MPQFDITTFASQIFWLLVCFGILIFMMAKIYMPRLESRLQARAEKLRHDLETSKNLGIETITLETLLDEKRMNAERQATDLLKRTLVEMEAKQTRHLEALDVELADNLNAMQESLIRQKAEVYASLAPIVDDCVAQLIPKLLNNKDKQPIKLPRRKKTG